MDRRTVSGKTDQLCASLWLKHVTALMNRNVSLDTLDICGASQIKHDRDISLFRKAQIARPERGWKQWVEEGGEVEDTTDCDPRLPQLFFCVRDRGGWIGGVPASNVKVETNDSSGIVASAFFFNGVPAMRGMDIPETWKLLFDAILNRAMTMHDGRTLEIVQYNLESRPATRRRLRNDPEIVKFVRAMGNDFVSTGDLDGDIGTLTFRRRPVDSVRAR